MSSTATMNGPDGSPDMVASIVRVRSSNAEFAWVMAPQNVSGISVVAAIGSVVVVDVDVVVVTAAVSDLLTFNGFLAGFGEVTDDGGVYGVLLSAIQSDSRSNVLSTPFTMALDNTPARLQVGQEIPVVTGEAVGTDFQGGFRNIERQDVGTILEVTPQINDGDAVTLKIKLEVSSLTAFTAQSDSPILVL